MWLPSLTLSSSSSSAAACCFAAASSSCCLAPYDLSILEIDDTDGTDGRSMIPSFRSFSLISQLNIPGLSFCMSSIFFSMSGVATRGFDPPVEPGLIDPVSWYLKMVSIGVKRCQNWCLIVTAELDWHRHILGLKPDKETGGESGGKLRLGLRGEKERLRCEQKIQHANRRNIAVPV